MALFFFNRHNGTTDVEPFINNKYSKQDYYYVNAPTSCESTIENAPKAAECDTQTYADAVTDSAKQKMIDNCKCKYQQNVDYYLAKTSTDVLTNGNTNDVDEKYNQIVIKNVNLGIGLGLMMIYIYTTNYQ
jgi:hypothetical protein